MTSSAVNSTPSLQKMPLRNFAVISVESALYCDLSAASELLHTPSRPLSGSMYQSVSSAACCSPLDCEPALIAQILNQPAFLMVPSGFSRISSSFLGMSCGMPWAWHEFVDNNSCGIKTDTASSSARMRLIVFSLIAKRLFSALCAQARRGGSDEQQKSSFISEDRVQLTDDARFGNARLTTAMEGQDWHHVSLTRGSGRPTAPTSRMNVMPCCGSAALARAPIPSLAVVTSSRSKFLPTKTGQLGWLAGTRIVRARSPSGVYASMHEPPQRAFQISPCASTTAPSRPPAPPRWS